MTSSTSSSDPSDGHKFDTQPPVPALPVWRLGAVMLGVAFALVAAWEGLLAARGIAPADNPAEMQHWLTEFDRVDRGQVEVAIVGSSRVQIGISPSELATLLPVSADRVANLGVPFSSSLPMLRELAGNPNFKGTVVAEVLPVHFFGNAPSHLTLYLEQTNRPRPYLQAELISHKAWRTRVRSAAGHGPVQELRWALAGDARSTHGGAITSRLHPNRWYEVTVRDLPASEMQALAEAEADQFRWPGRIPTQAQLRALLAEVHQLVDTIEARGGTVLLVRMPSDRQVREVEDARFPDRVYWDALVAELPGHCVHFKDDPVLRALETYDGSHLGARESLICSRRLAEILVARGR